MADSEPSGDLRTVLGGCDTSHYGRRVRYQAGFTGGPLRQFGSCIRRGALRPNGRDFVTKNTNPTPDLLLT